MQTYVQQTLQFGGDISTSSPEVSPASRSASPENGAERRTSATCGRKCLEQYARFVPAGSWAKMFSELLIGRTDWYSSRCALTWKMRGTPYSRLYFRLAPSTPRTAGTEYGLLPTAMTQGLKIHGKNGSEPIAITMLPTPHASDASRGGQKVTGLYKTRKSGQTYMSLLNDLAVSGLLPTPNASEAEKYAVTFNPHSQMGRGLTAMAMNNLLPTPTASDYQSPGKHGTGAPDLRTTVLSKTGKNSRLSPLFVAEMMGFPPDWTELPFRPGVSSLSKPTETL